MVIIIGNQKGGAGKSTIALLLANYLTRVKSMPVTVIDMDYQQSINQKYQKAKVLENDEPYEVLQADLNMYPNLLPVLRSNKELVVIIDLPGKLDDDNLIPVLASADLVITPFSYDEFTFDSTVVFTILMKNINPKSPIVFIPNRIKGSVKYETKEQIDQQLNNFGKITNPVMERIDFQRVTTFETPLSVMPVIIPVFEQLLNDYFNVRAVSV